LQELITDDEEKVHFAEYIPFSGINSDGYIPLKSAAINKLISPNDLFAYEDKNQLKKARHKRENERKRKLKTFKKEKAEVSTNTNEAALTMDTNISSNEEAERFEQK
jgi:hypothetical protein